MTSHLSLTDAPVRTPLTRHEGIDFDLIELIFFAYRDFTSDPDAILVGYEFGRAHHRVLHFVNRKPGLTVAELLDMLRITKQSLSRVLKQLIDSGHILQIQGQTDRRQREIYPTQTGRNLALELARPQSRRIRAALTGMTMEERAAIERFLGAMVTEGQREQHAALQTDED